MIMQPPLHANNYTTSNQIRVPLEANYILVLLYFELELISLVFLISPSHIIDKFNREQLSLRAIVWCLLLLLYAAVIRFVRQLAITLHC